MKLNSLLQSLVLLGATCLDIPLAAQDTAFTYQGRLTDGGIPATGLYDFEFRLFDDAADGSQQGGTVAINDLPVTNGTFVVSLNFGAEPFDGSARWMSISVRPGASVTAYTTLNPRRAIGSTPYATFALTSGAVVGTGTVADTALSPNVALRAGGNTFSGDQVFTNGTVTIRVGPTTVQVLPDGRVNISSSENITFDTDGDFSLNARSIRLNALQDLTMKSLNTRITNDAAFNLSTGPSATIRSSGIFNVQSSALLNLQSALINLN